MTPEELRDIRARAEAASPGPWYLLGAPGRYISRSDGSGLGATMPGNHVAICMVRTDAVFLHAARTDVPVLCDEVERLRNQIAACNAFAYRVRCGELETENAKLRAALEAAIVVLRNRDRTTHRGLRWAHNLAAELEHRAALEKP